MRKRTRIVSLCAVAGVFMFGACVAGLVALDRYLDPFDDQPFNPVTWTVAEERETDRGPMARDAIRHLPVGTPKNRVRELLGDGEQAFRDPRNPMVDFHGVPLDHPETWVYWLGCWSGLGPYGFDSAYLYVHFSSDGQVVATEINGG